MLLIQTWTPGLDWEIQARGQRSRAATEAVGLVTLLAGTSAELVLPRARLHFCSLSRRVFHIRAGKTPSSPLCPLSVFEFLWSLSSSVRPSVRRHYAQRKRIPAVSPPSPPPVPRKEKLLLQNDWRLFSCSGVTPRPPEETLAGSACHKRRVSAA